MKPDNFESDVIRDFGEEWSRFKFIEDSEIAKLTTQARRYFAPMMKYLESNRQNIVIADFGAGSGRWSEFLFEYSAFLYLVEPSSGGFCTIKERFGNLEKIKLLNETIQDCSIPSNSLDLAVSLGVIHHITDPLGALKAICDKLKPNGNLLCYLYYNLDNRSSIYKLLWRISDGSRKMISRLPISFKFFVCEFIALFIYFPLARFSKLLGMFGLDTQRIPLHQYSELPFLVMRNDSLDRFGTRLEMRFGKDEIKSLLSESGFDIDSINFSSEEPFWTFSAQKRAS